MKIRTPKRPKTAGCRVSALRLVALQTGDIRSSRGRKAMRDHVASCGGCRERVDGILKAFQSFVKGG